VSDDPEDKLLTVGIDALKGLGRKQALPRLFETLGRGLMAFAGADRCVCAVVSDDGHPVTVLGITVEGERLKEPAQSLSHFLLRQVTRTRAPVVVGDARADRRWRSEEDQGLNRSVRSLAGIPVFAGERLAAVLCFSHGTSPLVPAIAGPLASLVAQLLAFGLAQEPAAAPPPEKPAPAREASVRRAIPELFVWRGLMTRSAAFKEVLDAAERVARTGVPVLIIGEDGTGKNHLARAIHEASDVSGPFVVINAGAIPDSLMESELFGYVKGAFTGAETDRTGLIGEADGGTLFLSDLQELSEGMQAALLRVLEEGVVRSIGSDEARKVSFRLMTATTVPPETLRELRVLRDDFFYRIQGVALRVPPLRERPEDIALLFEHFLKESGSPAPSLGAEAERCILLHSWPGNVRALRNEAQRLRAIARGEIRPEDLSFFVSRGVTGVPLGGMPAAAAGPLAEAVRATEKEQIERALALARGNKSEAARLLGVTRRSLYRRLQRHGLVP
jgi:two-component system, NtrC family, response regulator HydG